MTGITETGAVSGPGARQIAFREVLGRGGFGCVYLADLRTESGLLRRVAVKVLSEDMAASADIAARQRDEARLLSRVQHSAIVKVYELCEIHGRPAVVMEAVDGVDALALIKQAPLPARACLDVVAAAADALDAAWSAPNAETGRPLRVVHRDIKPANLLISRRGEVKVLDFGVARGDFEREGQTRSMLFGTQRFIAPEQWLTGQGQHPVDVYALGVTLIELLASARFARPPLLEERFGDHIEAVLAQLPPPPGSARLPWSADFADGILALVRDMLQFHPDDRPTAEQVRDRVEGLAPLAPGATIRQVARARVPGLIAARREDLKTLPLPDATPLSIYTPSPRVPSPEATAPLSAWTPLDPLWRPGSEATLSEGPRDGAGPEAAEGAPSPRAVEEAGRAAGSQPVPEAPAETFIPPDADESGVLPPPVVAAPQETVLPADADGPPPAGAPPVPAEPAETFVPEGADAGSSVGVPWPAPAEPPRPPVGGGVPGRDVGRGVPLHVAETFIPPSAAYAPGAARLDAPLAAARGRNPGASPAAERPAAGQAGAVPRPPAARSAGMGWALGLGFLLFVGVGVGLGWFQRAGGDASPQSVAPAPQARGEGATAPLEAPPGDPSAAARFLAAEAPATAGSPPGRASDGDPSPGPDASAPPAAPPAPIDPVPPSAGARRPSPPAPRAPSPAASLPAPAAAPADPRPAEDAAPASPGSSPPVAGPPPAAAGGGEGQDDASPAPEPRTHAVRITSDPVGATVWLDGRELGTAGPGHRFDLPAGRHAIRLRLGDRSYEGTVHISSLRANRFHWDAGRNQLSTTH